MSDDKTGAYDVNKCTSSTVVRDNLPEDELNKAREEGLNLNETPIGPIEYLLIAGERNDLMRNLLNDAGRTGVGVVCNKTDESGSIFADSSKKRKRDTDEGWFK